MTNTSAGRVKGQPTRYINGHGRWPFQTPEQRAAKLINTTKLCGCGCGQPTAIAKQSDTRRGWIKGQPTPYLSGHGRWSFRTLEQRAAARREQSLVRFHQRSTAHRKHLARRQKQLRAEHPELFRMYGKKYRNAHSDRRRAAHCRWRKANPDRVSAYALERRAAKRAVPSELILRPVVWERDGGICGICRQPADPTQWDMDHIISLEHKGPHVYWNVWVTCQSCNRSKGAKFLPYALKPLPDALAA